MLLLGSQHLNENVSVLAILPAKDGTRAIEKPALFLCGTFQKPRWLRHFFHRTWQ